MTSINIDHTKKVIHELYNSLMTRPNQTKALLDITDVLFQVYKKIDTEKMKAPSFLMVLTGTGAYAYRRKDGVIVVPIGCLKQ